MDMLLIDYLLNNATKYTNEEAIVYISQHGQREALSWNELNGLSNKIANMLISKEIRKGDKVGLLSMNSLLWLPIYFGILKAGAIVVSLNYNEDIDEIDYCLNLVECKALFLSNAYKCYDALTSLTDNQYRIFEVHDSTEEYINEIKECSDDNIFVSIGDNDDAAIYFSSGTTGRSKAILLTHFALLSAAETELAHHKQQQQDRFLCLAPLYHTGAKIHWFGSFLVGGCIVISPSTSPMSVLKTIEREKITIAFLLVSQIQDILDAISLGDVDMKALDLSSWRLMHSGAQPIPASLITRWCTQFPNMLYDTNYGLTEASGPGCIYLGSENIHKLGSIGRPDPKWKVDIVNEVGFPVEKGTIGELIIHGPSVMKGYYHDAHSTNKTIKNNWLYTGDMAYIDVDGFIYLVDRKKDVIISGGENIYPIQIENHIRLLQCVKDVAVIGLPNERMGEIIVAIIELNGKANCTKKDIMNHCEELPYYKKPVKIIFDTVIRNNTGKIDKKFMRSKYIKM